jgi:eukaryotic-like serine/threonine-protein kinase
MPQSTDPSRELLFGLLALQTGMIDQGALFAAFAAWTRDKARSLADHLGDRGGLDADGRAAIEAMVGVHVKKHGGDIEKSLAAVPANRSARASLAALGEPDIEATLARVARSKNGHATQPEDDDPEGTANYSVGKSTSDGQRFRILRPHAKGGLGAVFVALDNELHREVALKQILEKHADDPDSRQRFVAEAEITGGLEHPGVVPVYGLGTDAEGRPYYAMRFIQGESLRDAIARFHEDDALNNEPGRRSLELRKLLRRFTDVCNAIDYAHSRGVIHRDLKPANIIVGKHGETLVVDWGLAKAVGRADPSVGEQTLAPSSGGSSETLPGSALGTPAYMSPEQARGELNRLGPRSDVYSLGATLYCLLTGKPPFENEDIGVILRAVQEGQFKRPSQHDPALDKALEAVCLKAMAKEPEDRYPTPKALSEDVERWLADEPVTAWREPLSRRAGRWTRRNRTAVTALAASVLVALAGTSAVLAVQTRANEQLQAANFDLMIASGRVAEVNSELRAANVREKQRFNLAMDAIKTFHGEVSQELLMNEKQFESLRTKLLKGGTEFYGRLESLLKRQTDRESRAALGKAYHELGELTGRIGDQTATLADHRKALAVRRALASEPGADSETKLDVARSLNAAAMSQYQIGDMAGSRASSEEARSLAEEAEAQGGVAGQARAVLATAYQQLGVVLTFTGDPDGARAAFGNAVTIDQQLADANPSDTEIQSNLAWSLDGLGLLQARSGKPEAVLYYSREEAIRKRLADTNPAVLDYRNLLANCLNNAAAALIRLGRPAEARARSERAVALSEVLVAAHPNVPGFRLVLAEGLERFAQARFAAGDLRGASANWRRAVALYETVPDLNPEGNLAYAGCHAGLSTLAGLPGTQVPAGDRDAEADRAMSLLRRAVEMGYRDAQSYRTDPALEGLRDRDDFRLLLMDLVFPTEAFAQ